MASLKFRRFAVTAAIGISLVAGQANAETLLDTFFPDQSAPGPAWALNNVDPQSDAQSLAVHFTTTSAVTVNSILAAISGSGSVTFGIMGDSAGLPSNTFLHSVVLANPLEPVSLSFLGWSLSTPGDYWLAAVGQAGFVGTWSGGNPTQNWAFTSSATPTSPWSSVAAGPNVETPAARISTVSAVPEPTTYGLMLAGLCLISAVTRHQQQGRKKPRRS